MPIGEHHSGQLRHESAQAKGERITGEELKRSKWKEKDLKDHAKNHPLKVALAARLRRKMAAEIWRQVKEGTAEYLNTRKGAEVVLLARFRVFGAFRGLTPRFTDSKRLRRLHYPGACLVSGPLIREADKGWDSHKAVWRRGVSALAIGLLAEWQPAPFIRNGTSGYFLTHIHHLKPTWLIMLGISVAFVLCGLALLGGGVVLRILSD